VSENGVKFPTVAVPDHRIFGVDSLFLMVMTHAVPALLTLKKMTGTWQVDATGVHVVLLVWWTLARVYPSPAHADTEASSAINEIVKSFSVFITRLA
jgi:hypothetical protein